MVVLFNVGRRRTINFGFERTNMNIIMMRILISVRSIILVYRVNIWIRMDRYT